MNPEQCILDYHRRRYESSFQALGTVENSDGEEQGDTIIIDNAENDIAEADTEKESDHEEASGNPKEDDTDGQEDMSSSGSSNKLRRTDGQSPYLVI